jgi:aminoglycoside phosphotransferase (APT) family kinase protein
VTAVPGLDLRELRAFLDDAVPGFVTGELTASLVVGGRSNLTYEVSDGVRRFVVRRPPLGHVLATAHDMAREYRVISALHPTGFPVPEPVALGDPFYVMRFVEGSIHRTPAALAAIGPDVVRALILALVDRLADLHAIDPVTVGLAGFGRPDGYNERQVRRWKKQLDASRSRDLPGLDALHDRLARAVVPTTAGTIVHGDYRIDNVVAVGASIVAVLDWEMSTLGDPLADLALLLLYTGRTTDDGVLPVPGHPSPTEMIDRYATRSGRDVSGLRWYRGLAAFKLAVISEGIHYRHIQGLTVGDGFDRIGERVAPLAALGHELLGED